MSTELTENLENIRIESINDSKLVEDSKLENIQSKFEVIAERKNVTGGSPSK
jgi:hypothetical protein